MTLNHNNFTSIVNKATLGKLSHNFNYKWFPPLCSVSVPCTNVHDILTWVARQMWLEDQEVSYIPIWPGSPKSFPGFECWLIISLCIMSILWFTTFLLPIWYFQTFPSMMIILPNHRSSSNVAIWFHIILRKEAQSQQLTTWIYES